MIVCVCHGVSDRAIAEAAARGCSFQEIQLELRVATACSGCLEYAQAVFHQQANVSTPTGTAAGCGRAPPPDPGAPPGRAGD